MTLLGFLHIGNSHEPEEPVSEWVTDRVRHVYENGRYYSEVWDLEKGEISSRLPIRVEGYDPLKDARKRQRKLRKQQRKQRKRELVG